MTTSEHGTSARVALQGAEVSTGDLFDVLSDPHRRVIVSKLDEHGGPLPMDELANELARWRPDAQTDEITDEQSREAHLTLHHVHVPKMVDAGIAERDEDDTVSLVDECDGISMILDLPASE